tara:strand:- start:2797 stop:3591 length:795 start_codon:yes stop_codon:yes gene_type:complete
LNIWRLIAHHENGKEAIELMKDMSRIAIGWSAIGDLKTINPNSPSDISKAIVGAYPKLENSHLGGPSLWNLYATMKESDLVIVNANGKRECVFEVNGPYFFEDENDILGYSHHRVASLTSIDPEDLWSHSGSAVEKGQNIRWTLAACMKGKDAERAIFEEGAKFSVRSTSVERNPEAREKCIEHFGCKCNACGFDFKKAYGDIGIGYIHVHHRVDLSTKTDVHTVDPQKDLIPLCPNCHAMVHKEKPAMSVEKLKNLLARAENA